MAITTLLAKLPQQAPFLEEDRLMINETAVKLLNCYHDPAEMQNFKHMIQGTHFTPSSTAVHSKNSNLL